MRTILLLWISAQFRYEKNRVIILVKCNIYMEESLPALAGSKLYFEAPEINSGTQNKLAQPTGWGDDFLQSRKS
ncbi:hypothetical protein [Dysgonomonas sp. 25]|uniref:hypothetical protein n=1 Tax=Dysgonomonas sp. 25 TaxID=2302933 RepID=UPI0013D16820|nr:hypothetical protein [Dysgonomonas sp. 25]